MEWIIAGVVLLLVLLAIGLYSRSRITTTQKTKNLDRFRTYAFLPNSNIHLHEKVDSGLTDISEPVIKAVNENMQRAGYQLDIDNPELLVVLKANKVVPAPIYASYPYVTTLPVSPFYEPFSYRNYGLYTKINDYKTDDDQQLKGSLSVQIINRKTKNILWKGTATESVYGKNTSEKIAEYVTAIFKEYPTLKNQQHER